MDIVGVIGGGTMGAGIAEVCARAGSRVVVVESDDAAAARCHSRIASSLRRATTRRTLAAIDVSTELAATAGRIS